MHPGYTVSNARVWPIFMIHVHSTNNNKSKIYQLREPEMHELFVISLYYTEMPTSGNLKSGDSLFGIYYMKSYMRYRPSQFALMTVMAK